jgi:hypothetical protein
MMNFLVKLNAVLRLKAFLLFAFLLLGFTANVSGQTKTWDGLGNGVSWSDASNWNPYGVPTNSNDVVIPNNFSVTVNVDAVCKSLTINGTLQTNNTNRTLNISGNLVVGATGSFNLRRAVLTVAGATIIDGAVTDNNNNGSAAFVGLVNVSSTGSITTANNSLFSFSGGIVNNGTINQTGTGNINFLASQSLSGLGITSFAGAVSISNNCIITNSTTIFISNILNGSDVNAKWVNNGTLNYANATKPMTLGSLDASATNNTVNYNRGNDQSILSTVYYNLIASNAGTKTIQGTTSIVKGLLTVGSSVILSIPTSTVLEVQNGIQDDGTINIETGSTDGKLNFTTNSQSVRGNGELFLDGVSSIASGITVTNELSTGKAFTINGQLAGLGATSSFVNKGTAIDLNASTGNIMSGSVIDLSSFPNTFIYNRTGNQDILSVVHQNVQIGSSTKFIKGNTEIKGSLSLYGAVATGLSIGAYTLKVDGDVSLLGTSVETTNGSARIEFYGANNDFVVASQAANSTISYLRTGDQSVLASANYQNLELGGSGIKTLSGLSIVSGSYSSSVTLATASDLTFSGTTTCGGDINATAGTVTYNSTAVNIIKGTYNNLVINGAAKLCDYITVSSPITFGAGASLDCNGFIPADPIVTNTSFCQNSTATPLVATTLPGHIAIWYTAATGGTVLPSPILPSTTSLGTTSYWVSQKNNNTGCESNRVKLDVTINANPAIPTITTSGTTTFCAGGSVTLTSSATTGNLWSTGETTQSIVVNTSGSYTVTVTNASGCSATSAATVVTVIPLPAVPTASSNSPICQGSDLNLMAATVAGLTYVWSGPNLFSSTSQNSTITAANPINSGTYTVTVNDGTCSNTSTVTVVVNATPSLSATDISGKVINVCKNTDEVYSSAKTFSAYQWTVSGGVIPGGANAQNVTVHWDDDYISAKSITLKGTDANGCFNSVTVSVTTAQAPTETLGFTGTVQTYVCPGTTGVIYQLNTPVSPLWTWEVTSGATVTPNNTNYTASVNFDALAPETVTLKAYTVNSCGNRGPELSQLIAVGSTSVYAQANGDLTAVVWNTAANGSGTNYTYNNITSPKIKYYTNGKAITINNSAVTVGGIHVDGGSLVVNQPVTYNNCGNSEFYISSTSTVTLNNYIDASAGASNVFTLDGTVYGTGASLNITMLSTTTNAADFLYGFASRNFNGGTVTYNSTSAQILAPYSYPALTLDGSGVKQLSKAITVKGDITINAGATLQATTEEGAVDLLGNWVDNGTFSTNGFEAKVTLSSITANQNIKESGDFKALVINKAAVGGAIVTLTGNLNIAGYLNFAGSGVLRLNTSNLILNAGAYIDANGDKSKFNSARMIEVTGSTANSLIIKNFHPTADLKTGNYYEFFAPIGNAGNYTPMNIRPLLINAGFPATGRSITVTTLPLTDPGDPNWVKRQWVVTSTFDETTEVANAYLNFNYDGATELAGKPTLVRVDNTQISNGFSILGSSNIFSFGTTSGNTKINGTWTCSGTSTNANKYYSVKAGAWEVSDNWSTNYVTPEAGARPAAGGPNTGDEVVIRAGADITKDPSVNKSVTSIEIEAGAVLDLGANTASSLTVSSYLSGQGTLKLSTAYLPMANIAQFVAATGGTIEYYGSADYPIDILKTRTYVYNNIIFSGNSIKMIPSGANPYTINGNFEVKSGVVKLDTANYQSVTLNMYKNINVASGAIFNVGYRASSTNHIINLYGNLTNNGIVRFTNNTRNYYKDSVFIKNPANGFFTRVVTTEAKLRLNLLNPTQSQNITCNGRTDFYWINVDKGPGQNPSNPVVIRASALGNFGLYGIANGTTSDGGTEDNSVINKPLAIQKGTLILGDNIRIFCLTTDHPYKINADAQLVIDGAFVDSRIGGNGLGWRHTQVNGIFELKKGIFTAHYSNGLELWNYGTIKVSGGVLKANTIFNTNSVTSRGGVEMTGGKIRIEVKNIQNETLGGYGRFNLKDATTFFRMSGGLIEITDEVLNYDNNNNIVATSQPLSDNEAFNVASNVLNTSCTGGKIVIMQGYKNGGTSADRYHINSTAALQNLELRRISTLYNHTFTLDQNLTINDSLILSSTSGNRVSFTSGAYTVSIGGDLVVQGNSSITATGLYRFNGSSKANQTINLGLTDLTLPAVEVVNSVTNGEVKLLNRNFTVSGNLTLTSGTLNDGGKTITVNGNIANNAIHKSETGGSLVIGVAGTQCQISGNGNGVFGNLNLNRTNGALTSAKQTIAGTLMLTNGVFRIATNNLTFTNVSATPVSGYTIAKYISTSGNKSDGGVTYQTSGVASNLYFPVAAANIYLPFTVNTITSTVSGSITVKPSNTLHKLANATSLTRFWTVDQTGYDNMSNYQFTFDNQATITTGYVAARIREGETTWTTQSAASGTTFGWTESSNNFSGDYTCGNGLGGIIVFTSNGTGGGDWNTVSTWIKTLNGVVNTTAPLVPVGISNCRVIIQKTDSVYVPNDATYTIGVGALQIADGARLDLGTTLSSYYHDFGSAEKIGGRGKLLISYTNTNWRFPQGDFGNFLGPNGGTVEYYANGAVFSIPTTNATYYNLIINKRDNNARIITVGQSPLTVYNNLSVLNTSGSNTLTGAFAANPLVANVSGSLNVGANATMTMVPNNNAVFSVYKNVNVANNANLSITAVNGAGSMVVYGNISNNGTIDLFSNNARYYDLKILGSNSSTISGTSTLTQLNRLIVDKSLSGSRDTMVYVTVPNYSLNAVASGASNTKPLVLTYGTYRHGSISPITLNSGGSSSDFVVNQNAVLQIDNGSFVINATPTPVSGANQYSGLQLFGKLKVTGGTFTIENGTNENYIQYSGNNPEIEVTGGQLTVGSQIRRFGETATGSLVYSQSGGNVNLFTTGAANSLKNRGVFEVVNDGQFNMSGGTLTINRASGNSLPEFYIETSIQPTVFGGTINLGNPGSYSSTDTLDLYSSIPLGSINIYNNNSLPKDVLVQTYDLVVKGNLSVADGAVLAMKTNNLDLYVAGNLNFNTSGNYISNVNTTYLNGTTAGQTLTAAGANFYNLQVSNTSGQTVKLAGSGITVKNDLTLDQGTFDLQANAVSLLNNLVFNVGKSINSTGGYISFDNASHLQSVTGSAGEVDNIQINNSQNVRLGKNLMVHKGINFINGFLDVDMYDLSVESTTAFTGSLSKTNKIRTPGTISGGKVIMQFNGGSAISGKEVPVGAQDRYTPVTITTDQSDNSARLEIKPVFAPEPFIVDIAVSQALNYYWMMKTSSGYSFPSTSSISFTFKWDDSPTDMALGNLTDYLPACFHISKWCLFPSGVDGGTKSITFSGLRADTLDGDYTAGAKPAFTIIPTLFKSLQTGNLTDGNTWDQKGAVPQKGDIIQINNNHIVTFDKSMLSLSATLIDADGELDFPETSKVNILGTVEGAANGTGTLALVNAGWQDGNYDAFFLVTGGTLEYRNEKASSFNITDKITAYNHLVFNDVLNGSILLPTNSFNVLGNLTIKAGIVNGAASVNTITLNKDFINNGTLNANNLSLEIKGSVDQTFSGTGVFNLNKLLLNKTAGDLYLDATNPIQINGNVSFSSGKLKSTNKGSITFNTGSIYSLNADKQSYATIKVAKVANNESFIFPVGNNYMYRPIEANTYTGTASAQYFNNTPLVDDVADIDLQVSEFEYWKVNPSATNNFTFRWTDANMCPLQGSDMTLLRLARWDATTSKWVAVLSTPSGTVSSGSINVADLPAGEQMYTLAAIQKMSVYCPSESGIYEAKTFIGTGTIVYNWTLSPSTVGHLTIDPTNSQKATVAFDGTNPDLYNDAKLILTVTQNGDVVRKKTYKLITYPRTPALNLPAFVCAGTNVPLQISNEYTKSEWYSKDTNPSSVLANVYSGTTYNLNITSPIYLNVKGFYTYKDSKGYSYKECPSLLLDPNKLITPISVTPGGVYRYPNK